MVLDLLLRPIKKGIEAIQALTSLQYEQQGVTRRDFLRTIVAAGASGALASCSRKAPQPKSAQQTLAEEVEAIWKGIDGKRLPSQAAIEREISKWAPWAHELIERYPTRESEKLKFAHLSQEDNPSARNNSGSYIPEEHRIITPSFTCTRDSFLDYLKDIKASIGPLTYHKALGSAQIPQTLVDFFSSDNLDFNRLPESELKTLKRILLKGFIRNYDGVRIDTVDHETSHALLDSKKGVLFSEHYSGPSYQDIVQLMLASRKKEFSRKKKIEGLGGSESYDFENSIDAWYKRDSIFQFFSLFDFLENFQFNPEEWIRGDELAEKYEYDVQFVPDIPDDINVLIDDVKDQIVKTGKDERVFYTKGRHTARDRLDCSQRGSNGNETVRTYSGEAHLKEHPEYILIVLEKGKFAHQAAEPEISHEISYVIKDNSLVQLAEEAGISTKEMHERITRYRLHRLYYRVFTEILAREVDGLMNVNTGGRGIGGYRIDEKWIDLFSQMKYKGQLMFQEQVEKARIALKFDKYDPSVSPTESITLYSDKGKFTFTKGEVQDSFEKEAEFNRAMAHATKAEYNGKVYEWKRAPFSFSEKLPVLDKVE